MTWKEALADLGYEVLVRDEQLFLGQDLGTDEAEIFLSHFIGCERPDTEMGKILLSEIREQIGK